MVPAGLWFLSDQIIIVEYLLGQIHRQPRYALGVCVYQACWSAGEESDWLTVSTAHSIPIGSKKQTL